MSHEILKVTHVTRTVSPEDQLCKYGPRLAAIHGNRVQMQGITRDDRVVILSDESIPDEFLPLVLSNLYGVDTPEGKAVLKNSATQS